MTGIIEANHMALVDRRSLFPIPRMELRDHRLMSYRGIGNWPPVWICREVRASERLHGEVGILRDVLLSAVDARPRLFLIMEHQGEEYIGCLLFGDRNFCDQIYSLLKQQIGSNISDIGGLNAGQLG